MLYYVMLYAKPLKALSAMYKAMCMGPINNITSSRGAAMLQSNLDIIEYKILV